MVGYLVECSYMYTIVFIIIRTQNISNYSQARLTQLSIRPKHVREVVEQELR